MLEYWEEYIQRLYEWLVETIDDMIQYYLDIIEDLFDDP